jgi:RNA-directed DNA polymerase
MRSMRPAAKLRLFYIRFMDDILILAPTRWQLRGAVKVVNQTLGALSLEKHPAKTFIGRIERGFDFLGYHFGPAGLAVAKQTIANFIEKASRLYEQERGAVSVASPLEMYVRRWVRWVKGGIASEEIAGRALRNGGERPY